MPNLIQEAKQQIQSILEKACEACVENGELPGGTMLNGTVEIPRDISNGDFAANHAMTGAKALHMAPRQIAEKLIARMDLDGTWYSSAESAGPGFLNFRLNGSWYSDVLKAVAACGREYGKIEEGHGQKWMVEFVSAPTTEPVRRLYYALASVLDMAGYEVTREFYVNDTGNQIEKFASSIDARYRQLILGEDAVSFPDDGYHGEDIRTLAADFYAQEGDVWLNREESERHAAMAEFGLKRNIPKMKADLERYGIVYDSWFLESSLHESGFVRDTMQKLTELGYTYEKDGALWLKTAEILAENLRKAGKSAAEIAKLELKDDVLRRANGFYTYFAADIAYHRNKFEVRGYDKVINIWGADHHGHVARLKGAMDALGLDGEHRLEIVLMQLVKLLENGEEVRMSKRTGKMISLSNLLEEIPVDAARYFFNSKPESTVEFDLELAKRQDSENPVYYVQYAHARICTMLANLAEEGYPVPPVEDADLSLLTAPEERELIRQLAGLPEEIRLSARDLDPSRINKYVTELAARFHKFYTVCRIKGAEQKLLNARLVLADSVRTVIENSLTVIGVSAPEKM